MRPSPLPRPRPPRHPAGAARTARRARGVVLPLLLLLTVLLGSAAGAATLPSDTPPAPVSLAAYRAALQALDQVLATLPPAQLATLAPRWAAQTVQWQGETLHVDPLLVQALTQGSRTAARRRVALLLRALPATGSDGTAGAGAAAPDATALARIARDQQERRVAAGGETGDSPFATPERVESVLTRIGHAIEACWDFLGRCWDWFWSWFRVDPDHDGGRSHGVRTLVLLLVGAVLLGILLLQLLRRQGAARGAVAAVPVAAGPARDADPRSRAAEEWLRYAQELEREGRWREAVRASYHAALVLCWRVGVLRHRPGWTNWEYALALPSSWGERATFIDLTQRFDHAWYGGQADAGTARAFGERTAALCASLGVGRRQAAAAAAGAEATA